MIPLHKELSIQQLKNTLDDLPLNAESFDLLKKLVIQKETQIAMLVQFTTLF